MKKLSLIILGIIIGALGMYYFGSKCVEDDFKIPEGLIRTTYADSLNKNWTEYRKPAVDSCAALGGHKQDDRSVWWSAKELKNYLKYSKKKADSLNYKITGYRVYLGVYGQEAGTDKCDLSTMFITPTGVKSISQGSMNPFPSVRLDTNIPIRPLNHGSGGTGGYP